MIEKYKTDVPVEDVLDPYLNAPRFILPENFDATTGLVHFDFHKKDNFFDLCKEKLNTKEMK